MNIIGKAKDSLYICEIDKTELEKFLGLYYGKMERLEVGQSIDLGRGYDYSREIKEAMKKTQDFVESNRAIIKAITDGLTITTREGAA